MNALVYGSSLVAAFLGGSLALFAPCCVVSLLPMFVAASLHQKRLRLIVSSVVYAAGVAVVMLPLVLGIGALGELLSRFHREVFLLIGLFLVGLGLYSLSGRGLVLPMPMLRTKEGTRSCAGGIFVLGVLSGMASSCCAPVLVGVVAMSALASSVVGALGLGLAYVFGMVFPLLMATLLWERFRLGESRLFAGGVRQVHIGGWSVAWTDLAAAGMFVLMGGLSLFVAVTGQGAYAPDWLAGFNRWASGEAGNMANAVRQVPTGVQGLVLLAIGVGVVCAVHGAWHRTSDR